MFDYCKHQECLLPSGDSVSAAFGVANGSGHLEYTERPGLRAVFGAHPIARAKVAGDKEVLLERLPTVFHRTARVLGAKVLDLEEPGLVEIRHEQYTTNRFGKGFAIAGCDHYTLTDSGALAIEQFPESVQDRLRRLLKGPQDISNSGKIRDIAVFRADSGNLCLASTNEIQTGLGREHRHSLAFFDGSGNKIAFDDFAPKMS